MATLKTPGVYIEEINAFPSTIVAVPTAVPAFIGYTQKAERNGKSLAGVPIRISSFIEFAAIFGGRYDPEFTIRDLTDDATASSNFVLADRRYLVATGKRFWLYDSLRLFYANGGCDCYILSVGNFEANVAAEKLQAPEVWMALERVSEPTMIVIPDAVATLDGTANAGFYSVCNAALKHCQQMQSRIAILDVPIIDGVSDREVVSAFREGLGIDFLNYGAAYYPWLNTNIVQLEDITFKNIGSENAGGVQGAPTQAIARVIGTLRGLLQEPKAVALLDVVANADRIADENNADAVRNAELNFQRELLTCSPTYAGIMNELLRRVNVLPPSGAVAGVYTRVDNSRGVWKAPANVSLSNVTGPTSTITNEQQEYFTVDVLSGKSINVIRAFQGQGALVWGARTLDGNSQDWRYVNVRRTMTMLEQSIKAALSSFVFEPNTANTWITLKSMITNFMMSLWREGALAGAKPEDAFVVAVGLGATMTADDILDGRMVVEVGAALVRPAEFIVIRMQQMMQQS
jgi:hypothetical protein